jgi:hypothetical protein
MRFTSLLLNQVRAYENIIPAYEGSNDRGSHFIVKTFINNKEDAQLDATITVY